jgi:hypothetical protein
MSYSVSKVAYFSTTVEDQPGEAFAVLTALADLGVELLGFTGVPAGDHRTQLTLFPKDVTRLQDLVTRVVGLELDGPHPAFFVQGGDGLGALVRVHQDLSTAGVNVSASSGVADGLGGFGYIIYIRPEEMVLAMRALGL